MSALQPERRDKQKRPEVDFFSPWRDFTWTARGGRSAAEGGLTFLSAFVQALGAVESVGSGCHGNRSQVGSHVCVVCAHNLIFMCTDNQRKKKTDGLEGEEGVCARMCARTHASWRGN